MFTESCHISHPPPPKQNNVTLLFQNSFEPDIRIGREIQCLPYAGFFIYFFLVGGGQQILFYVSVLLSASVKRFGVSRKNDFLQILFVIFVIFSSKFMSAHKNSLCNV
jgi:hypothetical protein